MLPLTSIVYSYASIAWVIWKSSHRVQRGVHMRNERIVMLDAVDETTILYSPYDMIEKNSFMTYDIGWGLAGLIFLTRVHLFNRKFR